MGFLIRNVSTKTFWLGIGGLCYCLYQVITGTTDEHTATELIISLGLITGRDALSKREAAHEAVTKKIRTIPAADSGGE